VSDQLEDVQDFHDAAGVGVSNERATGLRAALVEEEAREFAAAAGYQAPQWVRTEAPVDLVELADAAADIAYVALGTLLHLFGEACARDLWAEVHRSNMDKFPGGRATLNAAGKVVKPANWKAPDILGVLLKHGIVPEVLT
jgi:predicted HAD superfamily Cof-like phosphohydrolase